MTKDQERKALEKIAAILEETGKDSYLNMTFAGILEQAEENITNDFAGNYKEMYEQARDVIDEMNRDAQGTKQTINELEAKINNLNSQLQQKSDRIDELKKEVHDMAGEIEENIDKIYDEQKRIEELESEIITLKAKLYDMITA